MLFANLLRYTPKQAAKRLHAFRQIPFFRRRYVKELFFKSTCDRVVP
jgi:hypothetical protein